MITRQFRSTSRVLMFAIASIAFLVSGCSKNDGSTSPCSGGTLSGTPVANGSIITPYVNSSDILTIPEAFGTDASTAPWGFAHAGLDLAANSDHIPFQAVTSG